MRKIKTIRVYNLVDSKGNKLQLELGIIQIEHEGYQISTADKGYRWRFIGKHIPMPVRSRCWFNGFPENIMLDWLKGNEWYPHTRVEMCNGYADVYELPKGNESCSRSEEDERAFCEVIRTLKRNGKSISAVRLYRYANGGSLNDAYHSVKEICGIA